MALKYKVEFNGKYASRLYGYINLDKNMPPRLMNENNKEDNDKMYAFFSKYN